MTESAQVAKIESAQVAKIETAQVAKIESAQVAKIESAQVASNYERNDGVEVLVDSVSEDIITAVNKHEHNIVINLYANSFALRSPDKSLIKNSVKNDTTFVNNEKKKFDKDSEKTAAEAAKSEGKVGNLNLN